MQNVGFLMSRFISFLNSMKFYSFVVALNDSSLAEIFSEIKVMQLIFQKGFAVSRASLIFQKRFPDTVSC